MAMFRRSFERETKNEEDKIDSVVKSKLQGNEQLAEIRHWKAARIACARARSARLESSESRLMGRGG